MIIHTDFFSDTNVNPSEAMRRAMANAKVGNEVAGEDPTVNKLLERVCLILNKPAATFMPSGSMCNSVGLRALCQPGDRIVLDKTAHSLNLTAGMIGGLIGAVPAIVDGHRGQFTVSQIKETIGKNHGYNISKATVIAIEQTTNFGGGAVWPLDLLESIYNYAKVENIKTHMDGARLFNACVATNISGETYSALFDSVWIDFSKGLGAPMGAVIAGEQSFIDQVWRFKFQQGGAMHQAGILAAACLYALDNNMECLYQDHEHAALLANLLANINGIVIEPEDIETNIVIFSLSESTITAPQLEQKLLEFGIRIFAIDQSKLRVIMHMDINKKDVYKLAKTIEALL